MSFQKDVERAAAKLNTNVERVARKVVTTWFNETINLTPVDTGRLVGNWQTSKDSPTGGTIARSGKSGAISEVSRKVIKPGNYWLVNNLPYAVVAEYGRWGTGPGATEKTTRDGYSVQAPYGMARVSLLRVKSRLRSLGVK